MALSAAYSIARVAKHFSALRKYKINFSFSFQNGKKKRNR